MARRSRSLLWLPLALLIGALIWVSSPQQTAVDLEGAPAAAATSQALAERPLAQLQSELQERQKLESPAEVADLIARTEVPVIAEATPPDALAGWIEGEVLALDVTGQELGPMDGKVTLRLLGPEESIARKGFEFVARVEGGRFRENPGLPQEQLALINRFVVLGAVLGGQPAAPPVPLTGENGRLQPFRMGEALRVWLVCMPEHRIEVFAAESGEPIPQAYALPGSSREVVQAAFLFSPPEPSPCPLALPITPSDSFKPQVEVLVGASGRAWKAIWVDLASPAAIRVGLERSASLEVAWPGPAASGQVHICQPQSLARSFDIRRGGETLRLEGLPPGQVRVLGLIAEGDAPAGPVFGSAEGLLVPSETTRLVLVEDSSGTSAGLTTVAGRVRVRGEWPFDRLTLEGESPDPLVAQLQAAGIGWSESNLELVRAADSRVADFRFERVPPGKFKLRCSAALFAEELTVPPEGLIGLELEIGPPAPVRLAFVDRASGEPVGAERCHIHGDYMHGITGQGTAPLELRVPPGELRLVATFQRHVYLSTSLDVPPEGLELLLPVDRCPMVTVSLPEGVAIGYVEGPSRWLPQAPDLVAAEGHAGNVIRTEMGGSLVRFLVDRPGRYRLTLPLYAEFQPIPPLEFDLVPGQEYRPILEWIPR